MRPSELLAQLVAENPELLKRRGGVFGRTGVHESADWLRIVSLPRREVDYEAVPDLTPLWATKGGTMRLWPAQSAALLEAEAMGGAFLAMPVGAGKSLTAALMPYALKAKCAVLLVPAQLKRRTLDHVYPELRKHFALASIHVVSYTELERVPGDVLERLSPDLVIADEAHYLKNRNSARASRFYRYMKANPQCRCVAMSGTFSDGKLADYAPLMRLCLGTNAPVPLQHMTLVEWSESLDVSEDPRPPGALERLCTDDTHAHGSVHSKFACRLTSSRGVLALSAGYEATPLTIRNCGYSAPASITAALDRLRKRWELVDPSAEDPTQTAGFEGAAEEIVDDLSYHRYARQLALGFWLRWAWPARRRDDEWLSARAGWNATTRHILRYSKRAGLDSPLLVANAAIRRNLAPDHLDAWDRWASVKDRPLPPTEVVWITKEVVEDAANRTKGVVWYENVCVGQALSVALGVALPGKVSDLKFDGRPVPLSLHRFSTGVDGLQHAYNEAVYTAVPSAKRLEQSLGRLHREGQTRPMTAAMYLHTPELVTAFEHSKRKAQHAEETGFGRQKVLHCTLEGMDT